MDAGLACTSSRSGWEALLASVLLLAACQPGGIPQPLESGVFDVYGRGVPMAEMTIGDGGELSVRHRDRATLEWSETTATEPSNLLLPGSLARLVDGWETLGEANWSSADPQSWPVEGPRHIGDRYLRHREMNEEVEGEVQTAWYWALEDATAPLDLVFDGSGHLVAGVDPWRDFVLVRRGWESFTTVGRWRDASVTQPRYGIRKLEATMPTSAGFGLKTLIYLPVAPEGEDAPESFSTVFFRTPYGISNEIDRYWNHVSRGYALVFQSVRGTSYTDPEQRSEGQFEILVNEPEDGAQSIRWIAEQPWSNGRICMQGGSYPGFTQWAASMADDPALECIIPTVSMGTGWSDQPYMGGTFVQGMAYYVFWMLDKKILPERNWDEILAHRPISDIDVFATGEDIPQWNRAVEHATNDEYWQRQNWYKNGGPRDFGSFQISGWWDDDFPGTRSNWAFMQKQGVGPQRLLIGPWKHNYNMDRALAGVSFGGEAVRDDIWLLKQQWYDFYLSDHGPQPDDIRVDYFTLGSNEWRTATEWPPNEAIEQPWYLHSTGEATRSADDGLLSPDAPTATGADRYVYDPAAPPQNWRSFELMKRWEDVQSFPIDPSQIEAREDVAVFTSAPLEEDLDIAGDLKLVLYASTDAQDTDWWAHLSDVDESGKPTRIALGVLRARFRNLDDPTYFVSGSNFETQELLSGDIENVVRYDISVRSIANTFRKGHRVRIAIMNALDNYSFPNSNTGKHEAYVTETVPAQMVIHHSPEYPSHFVLPVMPKRAQAEARDAGK